MTVLQHNKNGHFLKNLLLICCFAAVLQESLCAQEPGLSDSTDTDAVAATVDSVAAAVPVADTPVLRRLPDSVIQAMKKKKSFAYANDPAYWSRPGEEDANAGNWYRLFLFLRHKWVRNLVYLLMVGILLFAVYRLVVVNKLYLFYGGGGKTRGDAHTSPDVAMDEDYDRLILRSENEGDYRGGTRWQYLKALQLLNRNGIIRYRDDCTNGEYMAQAAAHPAGGLFRELTRIYEYAWYGGVKLDARRFEQVKTLFREFYATI